VERRGISPVASSLLLVCAALSFYGAIPPSIGVLVVISVCMAEFIRRMDQGIPLMQITSLIAGLQWLLGPLISYNSDLAMDRYVMYVPEEVYFHFAIPATAVYCSTLLLFGGSVRQKLLIGSIDRSSFFLTGLILVGFSFAAQFTATRAPANLTFFFHLCSQMRYVGAIYLMFSKHRHRYCLVGACCLPLFFQAAGTGMFHDLVLWLVVLFSYWFASRSSTVFQRIVAIATGLCFVFSLQVVKQDYRNKVAMGQSPSLVHELITSLSTGRFLEPDVLSLATARLNQGWIISAIMAHVPSEQPFANGETVKTAVVSSLVPRVVWQDKQVAGGRDNFRRFTGLVIGDGTSMSISPLGEAYANFGIEGGIAFMAVFGLGFSMLYSFALRRVARYPDLLFWLPLMFYQGVKAETELVVVANQLVKGAVVVWAGYYVFTCVVVPIVRGRRVR
jgi:hypothetical protein